VNKPPADDETPENRDAPDPVESSEDEPTLETRLRRLDEIVATLEGGEVELERGLSLFEEGVRHIREAESLLSRAELRVEELVGEAEALRVQSFEDPDE